MFGLTLMGLIFVAVLIVGVSGRSQNKCNCKHKDAARDCCDEKSCEEEE